jgi:hypothetical protein
MTRVTNKSTYSLAAAMHRLWTDHVVWTRLYIIGAIDERPEAEEAAARLLKNQEDIGGALATFYGKKAGNQLTDLLKQHIMIAVDLIEAAKSGDQTKFGEIDELWTRNAEEIAGFLSDANPNWPKADVLDLLNLHLELTKREATARLERNFDRDVEAFDDILTEILTLADALSDGIIKQFPDKFAA